MYSYFNSNVPFMRKKNKKKTLNKYKYEPPRAREKKNYIKKEAPSSVKKNSY